MQFPRVNLLIDLPVYTSRAYPFLPFCRTALIPLDPFPKQHPKIAHARILLHEHKNRGKDRPVLKGERYSKD